MRHVEPVSLPDYTQTVKRFALECRLRKGSLRLQFQRYPVVLINGVKMTRQRSKPLVRQASQRPKIRHKAELIVNKGVAGGEESGCLLTDDGAFFNLVFNPV